MSLILRDVRKTYKDPKELIVFEKLNLNIETGEIVAIIGPSGSGKTTLLNIIGLIDKVDEGEVYVFQKNVSSMTEEELANFRNENVGFIFQLPHLIEELTVFENTIIPSMIRDKFLTKEVKRRAIKLLEYVEVLDKNDNFPSEISGGEKRRVEIARALVNNPKIIIADEPTSNLDPNLKFSIMSLFKKINKDFGTTIVFSTHDYDLLEYANKVFKIENRTLVALKFQV
ncbi:MAG: ABC transporter ATP-binding protein [candidate division WOR-3 bacterium]|nr:ABC transporter ATP-binding protein [candidate division WOR-3 bacterium]MCX7948298.1 ABC transporter ATP-binding protein [candidate division WOR-3 bacterium]MDW8151156.1 ABC transporter ATP-binding protein [candidate division WOR-3 bacterium]